MTIHASTVNVRLIRPLINGEILLHDDETHTVVPVAIEPTDTPPWFEAGPPRGDTIRDDFDDYRRVAERIIHTLLAPTGRETADRDWPADCSPHTKPDVSDQGKESRS